MKIELPDNASEPQKYLRSRVVGAVEAVEVLMGFHQSNITGMCVFTPTELNPSQ